MVGKMFAGGNYRKEEDYSIFIDKLNEPQKAEDDFFRNSENESTSSDLYKSLLIKTQSMLFFNDMESNYGISLKGPLLELGGGYGYLSAYIKSRQPAMEVIYSDVSPEAVKKSRQYEDFFKVKLDGKWVTSAEKTPFGDKVFSTVLFFASFHHMQDPGAVLKECARILKPGGKVLLLLEPSCPWFLKPLYNLHVRRKSIKEKYYTMSEYRSMFRNAGLSFRHACYKNFCYRWKKSSTLYYALLSIVPDFLMGFLPCTRLITGELPDH